MPTVVSQQRQQNKKCISLWDILFLYSSVIFGRSSKYPPASAVARQIFSNEWKMFQGWRKGGGADPVWMTCSWSSLWNSTASAFLIAASSMSLHTRKWKSFSCVKPLLFNYKINLITKCPCVYFIIRLWFLLRAKVSKSNWINVFHLLSLLTSLLLYMFD